MPICSRCGTKVGIFSSRSFSAASGRCSVCDAQVAQALKDFRSAFNRFASDGVLTDAEWLSLRSLVTQRRVHLSEALGYIAIDAKALVHRAVEMTYEDGVVTLDEEKYIDYLMALLRLPAEFAFTTRVEIGDLRQLSEISRGRLPLTNSSIELSPGEICHCETNATYASVAQKPTQQSDGRMIVTNQRLVFVPYYREGFDVRWNSVHSTWAHENRIYIETLTPRRNAFFTVERPRSLEALVPPIDGKVLTERRMSNQRKNLIDSKLPKTPYDVLGIAADATPEETTLAYRQMAKLYHPDKVSSLAGEFQVLAETRMKRLIVPTSR
jgi:hypothetical protein